MVNFYQLLWSVQKLSLRASTPLLSVNTEYLLNVNFKIVRWSQTDISFVSLFQSTILLCSTIPCFFALTNGKAQVRIQITLFAMQVLRTVYTVTNHLGKECKGGLSQRRRGLLRTENIEKPLTQLVFCRGPPVEENFQTSKWDALYFLKKWCGPAAPIFTEHVTDCRLQLQRDPDHTTVTEMESISDIWTMLLNGIGQNKKSLSCWTGLIHHLPAFSMVLT